MTVTLLQLSVFIVIVIHLTSSQPTYDVTEQDNYVSSCERTEEIIAHLEASQQVLSQVVTAVSQLQKKMDAFSENRNTSTNEPTTVKGKLRSNSTT